MKGVLDQEDSCRCGIVCGGARVCRDLYWFLTGDIASAGTLGQTALTFEPTIRCNAYDASCDCVWSSLIDDGDIESIVYDEMYDSL